MPVQNLRNRSLDDGGRPTPKDVRRPKPKFDPAPTEAPDTESDTADVGARAAEYVAPPPATPADAPADRADDRVPGRGGVAPSPIPVGELADLLQNDPTDRLSVRVPQRVLRAVRAEVGRRQRDGGGDRGTLALELFAALPTEPSRLRDVVATVDRARRWLDEPRDHHLEFRVPRTVKDHLDHLLLQVEHHHQRQVTLTELVIAVLVDRIDPDRPPDGPSGSERLDALLLRARTRQVAGERR